MENTDSNILSVIVENGAVYIAGWVGRKIMNCIDFDTCRQAIVDVNHHDISTGHQLLILKDNGGLVFPSAGVVKVIYLKLLITTSGCNLNFTNSSYYL